MTLTKKDLGFWICAIIFGFLWAYGLSTRIGLLFISPLWLKAIILLGLGVNFTLLAALLIRGFLNWSENRQIKIVLAVVAIFLTTTILLLTSYHAVPFRTTHTLTLTPLGSEVKLVETLSPDDNLIDRSLFENSGDVVTFDVNGFRIYPNGILSFRQSMTGGLTLIFTADSGPVQINWDKLSLEVDPAQIKSSANEKISGWNVKFNSETNRVEVYTPGYTWGQPDRFWTILGGLLPVTDFISLTSLFLLAAWGVTGAINHSLTFTSDRAWSSAWLEALICFSVGFLLIKIDYSDFMPGWFLFFFLPAMLFLFYRQMEIFAQTSPGFSKISQIIDKIRRASLKVNQNKWLFWILILIVATLAVLAQLSLTKDGMGISGDSVHYINSAINLAEGNGYVRTISAGDPILMTGFPPIYPLSLTPGVWTGIGVETFARYQNTFLLFLTVGLSGWLVYQATQKVIPAIWTTFLLVMSPPILNIYAWVMSEPLSIVLFLVAVLLLQKYFKKPKIWMALLIGLLAGIFTLTRLAAIAFIPAFALVVLIFQKNKIGKRLLNATILSFAALLPVIAFFIRNSLAATQVSESRGWTVAEFTGEYWKIIGEEVTTWFKWSRFFQQDYQQFNALFVTLGVILMLVIFWLIFRKKLSKNDSLDSIIILLLISIPIYLATIILNTIFLTPQQTVSGLTRYMIPILILLFISLGKILHDYWQAAHFSSRMVILFVLILMFSFYYQDTQNFVNASNSSFRIYTDMRNECGTEVDNFLKSMPDQNYITNNCEYFYFMTGIPCNYLSNNDADYLPGGAITKAIENGTILAYVPGFGTQSESLTNLVTLLEPLGAPCNFEFLAWPKE